VDGPCVHPARYVMMRSSRDHIKGILVFAVLAYVHRNPLPGVGYVFEHGPMFRSLASDGYRPALLGYGATFFGGHTF
jgi:hypothetical protein